MNFKGGQDTLMVSTLDSRSKGLGMRSGQVIMLCSLARCVTLTAILSWKKYKWLEGNFQDKMTKCWK